MDLGYEYIEDGKYCYTGSNVLINKMNIGDQTLFDEAERSITLIRMLDLDENPIDGSFDLEHLKSIHRVLFGEIYDWAGEIRTVDISKGTMFCKCDFIIENAEKLFDELKSENYLHNLSYDEMVSRLAYYLSEINVIHPFREGNGRTQRAFITQLARKSGYDLDFTSISDNEMINASVRGFVMDYAPMQNIIRRCLKKAKIDDL